MHPLYLTMSARIRSTKQKNQDDAKKLHHGDNSKVKKTSKPVKKSRCKCRWVLLFTISIILGIYSFGPLVLRYSHWMQKEMIYVNRLNIPFMANLSNPSEFGLPKVNCFYLHHTDGCRIGVWHILPQKYHKEVIPNDQYASLLSDELPIILYLHGNTGSRATYSRVGLYKYLSEEKQYHVITFDYKGFGDSDCYPSESGLMEDGLLVWQWIKQYASDRNIYIWGHSLGSGATTYLTANLTASGDSPTGILLDAPFTTIIEAAINHPFSLPYRLWPLRTLLKTYSLDYFHETHQSIDRLRYITCPILIMHGHLDVTIPFDLGHKMYETALSTRKPGSGDVHFIDCGDSSHKYNFRSEPLRQALDSFIN